MWTSGSTMLITCYSGGFHIADDCGPLGAAHSAVALAQSLETSLDRPCKVTGLLQMSMATETFHQILTSLCLCWVKFDENAISRLRSLQLHFVSRSEWHDPNLKTSKKQQPPSVQCSRVVTKWAVQKDCEMGFQNGYWAGSVSSYKNTNSTKLNG